MKATFDLDGLHMPVVVLLPEDQVEEVLLAAFIRFDRNVFAISVDRLQNGRIEKIVLRER